MYDSPSTIVSITYGLLSRWVSEDQMLISTVDSTASVNNSLPGGREQGKKQGGFIPANKGQKKQCNLKTTYLRSYDLSPLDDLDHSGNIYPWSECCRKTTHRRHTYRVCMYLVSCICDAYIYACLSRSLWLYRAFFVARITNRHGHLTGCAGLCSACLMSMGGENTATSSVKKAWNMWLKWQQRDGCCFWSSCPSHPIYTQKNGNSLDGGPSHRAECHPYAWKKITINCWRLALRINKGGNKENKKNETTEVVQKKKGEKQRKAGKVQQVIEGGGVQAGTCERGREGANRARSEKGPKYVYTHIYYSVLPVWTILFTVVHNNQDPRWARKPIYTPIFTHQIRSWLLCTTANRIAYSIHIHNIRRQEETTHS